MTKIPYTYGQLLSTISPAAPIAIYADGKTELDELYKGTAIKSRDRADLLSLEVKHVGVNEQNRAKEDHFLFEIFLYDNGETDTIKRTRQQDKPNPRNHMKGGKL